MVYPKKLRIQHCIDPACGYHQSNVMPDSIVSISKRCMLELKQKVRTGIEVWHVNKFLLSNYKSNEWINQ